MKLILTICVALALTGCASHKEYYEAIKEIAKTEGIKATGPSNALIEAAKHSDPQVATAAAVGAGISEALRNAGHGGQQQSPIALIQAPPTALDYLREGRAWLLGGASVWQQIDASRNVTKLGLRQIDAAIEGKRIESDERRDIMDTVTGNMRAQTEAATKNPTSQTTIVASGRATVAANGSVATSTQETNSIECTATQTARAGDSQGAETAGAGANGGQNGAGGQGGNVTGGARSAPAAGTQTQSCTNASGKK